MLFKLLFALLALCLAPCALAQNKPIYFVVDASGSMQGKNQKDAEDLLRGWSLPRDQLISITFFGSKPKTAGVDLCTEELTPPAPTPRGDFSPNFPELGTGRDKTAIGNAVEAVLQATGDGARLILITDGEEECGADFVAISARYPNAEIKVLKVGAKPSSDLRPLEMRLRSAQGSSTTPTLPMAITLVPPKPEPEANWPVRLWWTILVLLSALAAVFFCLQSAERTKVLQDQLNQLDNKTNEELASLYKPMKIRKGKEVRKKDHERYRIYWFRNRRHSLLWSYGSWALFLALIASVGWLSLAFREVLLLVLAQDFVAAIRNDSWNFLNSNIGSYSFAGTIISLVGFCAFQWWQSLDAKKQLMIRSGIITTERAEVVRGQYDRARRAIQRTRFTMPSRYVYWLFSFEQAEIPGFDALRAKLIELAAPPFEKASGERLREVQNFVDIRDPLAFATLLKTEGQLTGDQLDKIALLLEHARSDRITEAAEVTRQLVEELSSAEPPSAQVHATP